VFPKPPPVESVVSCGDGGIVGPVVGVMGVLQAVEAVRCISSGQLASHERKDTSMLLFSAGNPQMPFRSVKLRSRRKGCFACSKEGGLTLESLESGSLDYVAFCGVSSPVKILQAEERVEAKEYDDVKVKGKEHVLVDVREKVQFDICHLEGSVNVPFSRFQGGKMDENWIPEGVKEDTPIYVVCRLGNDSQVVARKLKNAGMGSGGRWIGDIKDGLKAWREQVDSEWPEY